MLGLQEVITADVVEFEAARSAFDRVVSIEMFEHMKNYQARLRRTSAPCMMQRHASFCRQLCLVPMTSCIC